MAFDHFCMRSESSVLPVIKPNSKPLPLLVELCQKLGAVHPVGGGVWRLRRQVGLDPLVSLPLCNGPSQTCARDSPSPFPASPANLPLQQASGEPAGPEQPASSEDL